METALSAPAEPLYKKDFAKQVRRELSSFDPAAPGHNVQISLPLCQGSADYQSLCDAIGTPPPSDVRARLRHGQLEVESTTVFDRIVDMFKQLFERLCEIVESSAVADRFNLNATRLALVRYSSGTYTISASLELR